MQTCNCNQQERMTRPCRQSAYDLQGLPLGMAYVPWQHFDTVYELDKAINSGTIFPELYMPFVGKRGVRG